MSETAVEQAERLGITWPASKTPLSKPPTPKPIRPHPHTYTFETSPSLSEKETEHIRALVELAAEPLTFLARLHVLNPKDVEAILPRRPRERSRV